MLFFYSLEDESGEDSSFLSSLPSSVEIQSDLLISSSLCHLPENPNLHFQRNILTCCFFVLNSFVSVIRFIFVLFLFIIRKKLIFYMWYVSSVTMSFFYFFACFVGSLVRKTVRDQFDPSGI